jgi:K+-sensing histidine kinase KdpD
LYLVVVVLAALYGGFWQATVVSVAAAACLNYFFVPPIFSFANSPANWVALGAFEFTALVISRLSQRAQLQAGRPSPAGATWNGSMKPRGGYCCWIVRANRGA